MNHARSLRQQLDGGWVFAAGCFDTLSAGLAERVGFTALHLTGMGFEATQMGAPDVGVTTLPELASHVARISAAVDIPMIVDVDTGFGGIDNVMRTIREMERAGAGGVHIEDQVFPKRCPVIAGRTILPADEAVGRVRAAVAARNDPNFVIVGRSDADEISFDEVVRRSNLYLEAGADVAMPLMTRLNGRSFKEVSPDEQMTWLRRLPNEIDGPVLTLTIPDGYTVDHMRDAGFAVVILPVLSLKAAASAMVRVLREALHNGTGAEYFEANPVEITTMEIFEMFGLEERLAAQQRYGPSADTSPES